jgi:hypothetical protein
MPKMHQNLTHTLGPNNARQPTATPVGAGLPAKAPAHPTQMLNQPGCFATEEMMGQRMFCFECPFFEFLRTRHEWVFSHLRFCRLFLNGLWDIS